MPWQADNLMESLTLTQDVKMADVGYGTGCSVVQLAHGAQQPSIRCGRKAGYCSCLVSA